MTTAMNLLIQKKYRNTQKTHKIYFDIASYQRKIGDFDNEISSLVCSQAMARQLPNQEKTMIDLTHLIIKNYMTRELFEKALDELLKVEVMEK